MTDFRYRSPAWKRLRLDVLNRDGWTCRVRGRGCQGIATTADHIRAVAEGGEFWNPANLRAACLRCNSRLGAETAQRIGVRSGGRYEVRL